MYIGNVTANDPVISTSFYNTISGCVAQVTNVLVRDGVIRPDSANAMIMHFRNPEYVKDMALMYRQQYGVDPLTQNFDVNSVKNIMYAHVQNHQMQAQRELQMQSQMQGVYGQSMGIGNMVGGRPMMGQNNIASTNGMYQAPQVVNQGTSMMYQPPQPQMLTPNDVRGPRSNNINTKQTFTGGMMQQPRTDRFSNSTVEPIPDKTDDKNVFKQAGADSVTNSAMYKTDSGVVGIILDKSEKEILSKLNDVMAVYPKYIIKGNSIATKSFMHTNKTNMLKYISIVNNITDKLDVVNDLYFYLHESENVSKDTNVLMVDNIAVTLVNESANIIMDKFNNMGIENLLLEFENLREIVQLCNGDGNITDDIDINNDICYVLEDDAFRADLKSAISMILLEPVKYTNIQAGKNCVTVDKKVPILFTSADLSDVIPAFSRNSVNRVKLVGHVLNNFTNKFIGDYGTVKIHLNKSNLIKLWVTGEVLRDTIYLKR